MLHDIYYILPPQHNAPTADYIFAWQIDLRNDRQLSAAYQAASQLPATSTFSLYISGLEKMSAQSATDLIAFFFFDNYDKPAGIPRIIINKNNTAIQLLEEQAKAQGFSKIDIQVPPTVYQAHTIEQIWQTYKNWLYEPLQPLTRMYIQATEPADITRLHNLLKEEENLFSQQNGGLYNLKQQNKTLSGQVQKLERLYNAANQEISNQMAHVSILRSQSQTAALQNYYNNEYEILPLWYKQMGHVIKVIMGKRSFKSLFRNNVKKYKS